MKRLALLLALFSLPATAAADSYEEHDYLLNCAGCHQIDGSGSRTVPSLLAMPELRGKAGAREYWVQVPGAAQAPLSDTRLAALMNWLVNRFAGAPPNPPYTAAEINQLRATPRRNPTAQRKKLLTPLH